MNIVIQDTNGAHHFQHLGWAKVLAYAGHNVMLWNPEEKPILDLFNEVQVDIFFGQLYNVNRAQIKAFQKQPQCKLIFKAGDWGTINDNWNSDKYPVLLASKEEKSIGDQLKDRISFLHIHYHPNTINDTHGHWTDELGIPVYSSMNGADIFEYTNGQFYPELQSDVAFVGGRWGYKSVTLDAYLLKLCNPNLKLNVKIFGNTDWGLPQYCGSVPDGIVKHIFSSATVCPNISELHSQDFGYDIIERPFKLLSNKSFCISDNVLGLKKLFPDGIVFIENPQDFVEKTFHYLRNPDERLPFIKNGYAAVMKFHTYFDRIYDFFDQLYIDDNNATQPFYFHKEHIKICKTKLIKELSL